jgi:peroxiredoxin/glutaredoxin
VPGAYTPTCSSQHVPRFRDLYDQFNQAGIDCIACVSVNDAYVMKHWAEDLGCEQDRIMFLADGNGEFTKAMGMLMDKRNLGFGVRSRRYAMIVRDGVIEKMLAEPAVEGDPYDISSAESCLKALGQAPKATPEISIFTRPDCPFSHAAKNWLDNRKLRYHEMVVGKDVDAGVLRGVAGTERVPQIFINGQHIGGFDQLKGRESLLPQPAAA